MRIEHRRFGKCRSFAIEAILRYVNRFCRRHHPGISNPRSCASGTRRVRLDLFLAQFISTRARHVASPLLSKTLRLSAARFPGGSHRRRSGSAKSSRPIERALTARGSAPYACIIYLAQSRVRDTSRSTLTWLVCRWSAVGRSVGRLVGWLGARVARAGHSRCGSILVGAARAGMLQ